MPKKTNFTANGNSYFRTTATIGKTPDGKPIRKQFYGSSKKEAQAKKDEYMLGLRQGLDIDYDKNVFGVTFSHWLNFVHRHSIGAHTFNCYNCIHRRYIADCGLAGMRLVDIKTVNIQSFYNDLLNKTTVINIHQTHKLLRIFFGYCLKADILVKSPLLAVEPPKLPMQAEPKNTALSDADIDKLLSACNDNLEYFPFVFACFTGLRCGELLALTYKDIDFESGMVSVNKSIRYLTIDGESQPLISSAKTAASVRRVPILEPIQDMLRTHIIDIRKNVDVFNIDGDFILFPSATGDYRGHRAFLRSYQRLCDKLGIDKGRTIHSLRHTFCTILARQGVSLLDASRLMGHSNINITAKIYSHVSDDDKKNAAQKLNTYFA